jgi:dTDP-4-dehydrorhamnose reductase
MVTRRVLVSGASGRLGRAIIAAFADCEVLAHTRGSLDVTSADAVREAVRHAAPDVIVNCAAFNYVDLAEERCDEALAVNAFAVRSLARAAEEAGATFVHFGSDFVFDGNSSVPYDERAVPSPRSTYALTKLLGDWFALEAPRGLVLRVESLFGNPPGWSGRVGSLDTIVDRLEQGLEIDAFTDRVVSPSYVDDVAGATRHLVDTGAEPGLYHCVNSGCATWYEVAEQTSRVLGVAARLRPVTLDQAQLRAARPRFSALANHKLAAAGFQMPAWQDALQRWLAGRVGRHDKITGVHG